MRIDPILPIWVMAILCVALLFLKRKRKIAYIRQVVMIALLFLVNMRISFGGVQGNVGVQEMDAYVLFAVDDTVSMQALDGRGNKERMEDVREDCGHIIDELSGAKFSVMYYHNEANVMIPYTEDEDFAKNSVDSISPLSKYNAKGSSMNVCKEKLIEQCKMAKEKGDGRVYLFLVSDGEITNDDKLESFSKVSDYVDGGAVLGYGTKKGAKMYVRFLDDMEFVEDPTAEEYGAPAISKIDEENLGKVASDIGISYVHMEQSGDVDQVLKSIKKSAKSKLTATKDEDSTQDMGYVFILPLMILLGYEFLTRENRKE